MKMNILPTAQALTDAERLCRLATLALGEREATAELLAHLAVLDARPSAYRAAGYGSLFPQAREGSAHPFRNGYDRQAAPAQSRSAGQARGVGARRRPVRVRLPRRAALHRAHVP